MDMDLSVLWGVMTIIGPVLLGLALLWGTVHYRRRKRRGKAG